MGQGIRESLISPRAAAVFAAVVGLALGAASSAEAAYPKAKNGRIVFEHSVGFSSTVGDIAIINSDGSGQTALTNTPPPIGEANPAISPDRRLVAYQLCDGTNCEIGVIRSDGTASATLTSTPDPFEEGNPDFSPDGRLIAFDRSSPTGSDVFVMNADGSSPAPLANSPQEEFDPAWAPDGRTIYFTRCDASCQIWSMNADGTGQVALTAGTDSAGEAAVSPDGRSLAYYRCTGPFECPFIVVRDLRAGTETTLDPTGDSDYDPVFSPDGKKLAFLPVVAIDGFILFFPNQRYALATMRRDGSGVTQLTAPPFDQDDTDPEWEYVYRCGKRRATIVGDDGPDRIEGTKKRDVIVANAGRDVVRGRGGDDRICLGKGTDRVVGGGGEDSCVGGKGKDKGKGCEDGKL